MRTFQERNGTISIVKKIMEQNLTYISFEIVLESVSMSIMLKFAIFKVCTAPLDNAKLTYVKLFKNGLCCVKLYMVKPCGAKVVTICVKLCHIVSNCVQLCQAVSRCIKLSQKKAKEALRNHMEK